MSILNQTVANNQVRDGHQGGVDSGNVNPLHVDQYAGGVETQIIKTSFMRSFLNIQSVTGTDTVTNSRMGGATLQKVTRGVRPVDHAPTFDNISVKVDTIVLARSNQFTLDDFQSRLAVRMEIGREHGEEIGKFFDESAIIQCIKASQITNVDPAGVSIGGWFGKADATYLVKNQNAPANFQGGTTIELASANDQTDADLFERSVQDLCQAIEEKDVDITDAVIMMRPAQYYTLLRNDKLMSKDFSEGNGDFAKGSVLMANGVRIQKTNRFPTAAQVGTDHFLSNAGNGNAYNVLQADANCVAVLIMPKALIAGETIPLTSKVYFSDIELQWFVDSYLAYAIAPNRAEYAGGIFINVA